LRNRLRGATGLDLPPTLAFQHRSPGALCVCILDALASVPQAAPEATTAEPATSAQPEPTAATASRDAPKAGATGSVQTARSEQDKALEAAGRALIARMPHLEAYYGLDFVLTPYVNCSLRPNLRLPFISTDGYGFRRSTAPDGIVDSKGWAGRARRALALGNSFMLGWGSSSDATTLPSLLNAATDYRFLNLAVMGASSMQELTAALPFLPQAELVVVGSGAGNPLHYLEFGGEYDAFGAFFGQEAYLGTSQTDFRHIAALLKHPHGSAAADPATAALRRRLEEQAKPVMHWLPAQLDARLALAAEHLARDLRTLLHALPDNARLVFAMQPLAPLAKPVLEPDEQALLALYRQRPISRNVFEPYLNDRLPELVATARAVCEGLGIPFLDLNAVDYRGLCFKDYGHTLDDGNRLIARRLADWLEGLQ